MLFLLLIVLSFSEKIPVNLRMNFGKSRNGDSILRLSKNHPKYPIQAKKKKKERKKKRQKKETTKHKNRKGFTVFSLIRTLGC